MSLSSLRRAAALLAPVVAALGALPASASAGAYAFPTVGGAQPAAACTNPPTTQAFAKFRDVAQYALAPDGDFEAGGTGWRLTNAKVVDGNDTTGVGAGKKALLLGASRTGGAAQAVSPEFCVTRDHPSFRAVVRSVGTAFRAGFGANIEYRTTTALGTSYLDLVGIDYPSSSWAPTSINPLAKAIPDAAFPKGVLVRIVYYLPSSNVRDGGALQLDNVMIDPLKRS